MYSVWCKDIKENELLLSLQSPARPSGRVIESTFEDKSMSKDTTSRLVQAFGGGRQKAKVSV